MTTNLRSVLGILTLAYLAMPPGTAVACSFETATSRVPLAAQARCGLLGCGDETFLYSARGDRYRSDAPGFEDGVVYMYTVSGCFLLGYGHELGKPDRRATASEAAPFDKPNWHWPLFFGIALLCLAGGIHIAQGGEQEGKKPAR